MHTHTFTLNPIPLASYDARPNPPSPAPCRRVMLNGHSPGGLTHRDLLVTSQAHNGTSIVHQTHYNEDGYQFTAAVGRDYWLHWNVFSSQVNSLLRVDPDGWR